MYMCIGLYTPMLLMCCLLPSYNLLNWMCQTEDNVNDLNLLYRYYRVVTYLAKVRSMPDSTVARSNGSCI